MKILNSKELDLHIATEENNIESDAIFMDQATQAIAQESFSDLEATYGTNLGMESENKEDKEVEGAGFFSRLAERVRTFFAWLKDVLKRFYDWITGNSEGSIASEVKENKEAAKEAKDSRINNFKVGEFMRKAMGIADFKPTNTDEAAMHAAITKIQKLGKLSDGAGNLEKIIAASGFDLPLEEVEAREARNKKSVERALVQLKQILKDMESGIDEEDAQQFLKDFITNKNNNLGFVIGSISPSDAFKKIAEEEVEKLSKDEDIVQTVIDNRIAKPDYLESYVKTLAVTVKFNKDACDEFAEIFEKLGKVFESKNFGGETAKLLSAAQASIVWVTSFDRIAVFSSTQAIRRNIKFTSSIFSYYQDTFLPALEAANRVLEKDKSNDVAKLIISSFKG